MRLIDADALIQDFDRRGWDGVQTVVDMMPTLDVAPVVRCFYCIHRIYKDMGEEIGEIGGCELWGRAMPGDNYCSFGEKRKEADGNG